MSWIYSFSDIDYIAVLAATISSYVLGFVWYSWPVFGKAWANALNLSKEEADNTEGLGGAFIASLIGGLAKAICMALILLAFNITGALACGLLGATIATMLILASLTYYNGFARVPTKLTLINGAHSIVELSLIAAVIGLLS